MCGLPASKKIHSFGSKKVYEASQINNDEIDRYILVSRIRILSVLRGRIRSKTRPDPQDCLKTSFLFQKRILKSLIRKVLVSKKIIKAWTLLIQKSEFTGSSRVRSWEQGREDFIFLKRMLLIFKVK
jgi:hypothetical protein